jgi:hypothetical protein
MTTDARAASVYSIADDLRTALDTRYPDADELRPMTLAAINRLDAVIETGTESEIRKETARGLDVLEALDRLEENKREAKVEGLRPMIVNLTDDALDSILSPDNPVRRDSSDFARYVLIAASREREERRAEQERSAAKREAYDRAAGMLRSGLRESEDGTSQTQWAVFQGSVSNEDALDHLGWAAHYRGPGQWFSRRPRVQRRGSRVLVTQEAGLDI